MSFAGMMLSGSFAALMLSLGILFGTGGGALAFGLHHARAGQTLTSDKKFACTHVSKPEALCR